MHTHASNSELVEPLSEPERTLNRRLRRRNRRVLFEKRNERPEQPRVVYLPILDINYFRHFLDILENYNPMDDEPVWAADRVVAPILGSIITIPETTNEFVIKGNHLTLVKGNQLDGRIKTDPHKHIHEFLGICDMYKYRDTENEAVRLMMFPLSLMGEAKTWLNELKEGTIETEIRAFSQHENETLTNAWLRMKEMLRNCHGHNLTKGNIIKIFYHGLNEIIQEVLNSAAGGIFLYKTPNQAYQLLEDKVLLKLDWAKNQKRKFSLKKTVAFADVGSSNTDTDKIMARMDAMTMKMDALYKELQFCSNHSNPDCNNDDTPMSREEEAKFMQTFRRTRFHKDYRDRDSNRDNWRSSRRNDYNRDNYRSNSDDKLYDIQRQLSDFIKARQSPNAFSGKSYDPPTNLNDQQNDSENPINFNSDEEEESTPQPKSQTPKPVKETLVPKPYKPKIPYPQRIRKDKMEAQYGKFLDMTRVVRINVPLVDVLVGMPNYGKFLKELISNKHKLEQISSAFLSDESSTMIQNKVPPKLEDTGSFLIPCTFNKSFSCNALADLGASINLMPYSLYAKLSLETLKPTKMSVRLADRSFQYPIGIDENMLTEVGKFTFPMGFVILEMKEDSKVPLILGRPFLHTADAVIRVKQKQLNLGVGIERMTFSIDSAMKHSYSNDDTCFSIDVIDEILEEDFDSLLDEGSNILYSIEVTIIEENLFVEFNEFMPMNIEEDTEPESDEEEPTFEKITFDTDYKIKTSLEEPPSDLELKPLSNHLEYVFLEEPSFLPVIISSQLSEQNKVSSSLCILAIFHDMIEESMEVFMNDLSVFGNSFDNCLNNLDKMLQSCKDANLILNWEKCHFMVKEGIVLRHKVSGAGREVNKAKIDVISKLPPPTNVKGIRSFMGYASFYRRFIKDFSKIAHPLTKLLEKDTTFEFNNECHKAFKSLKEKLTCTPVTVSPNWYLPFELMCDASEFSVGAVLGQKDGKHFYPIYFVSKTLNTAQQKYTITEKELMAGVFAFDKFRPYMILSKTIVYTDHPALRHLFKKQDAKLHLIRWILLLQEVDIKIKDKKGTENVAADHLSQIENDETSDDNDVDDNFPGKTLMEITTRDIPWFADFANYLVGDIMPKGMMYQQKNKFFSDLKNYFREDLYLFKLHELDEFRHQAYENSRVYKARTKVWHDRKLKMRKEFQHENKVLLFHSMYKFKQLKLRSRWLRPYVVKHQYPSGYVELYGKDDKTFILNGHRLKLYHEEYECDNQRE
ncbi:reverse transcriptase domain-containing protein [Tanacetum coccineum]|uniref:RNA-directed DNA polymerase n=1 Tax=Tanacetum coccineum TaxID=301880 RepID=A0ABQ5CNZ1_9ASTR